MVHLVHHLIVHNRHLAVNLATVWQQGHVVHLSSTNSEIRTYWISFARMLGSDLNASAEALQALAMLRPNPAVARV